MTFHRLFNVTLVAFAVFLAHGIAICADKESRDDDRVDRSEVFDSTRIWKVVLTISAEEYAAMQPRGGFPGFGGPRPAAPATEVGDREVHRNAFGMDLPWAKGSITIGGESFEQVGIRYKGNGTIADASRSIKKSFKVDLDRLGGKARFHGLKTLNLHCGITDPSKSRETLGYEVYRAAGVPAPLTTLAEVRLTVPGKYDQELLGIYTIVEQVDKPFLAAQFGSDKGLLMKPDRLRDLDYLGHKWEDYTSRYLPRQDASKKESARMIEFARLVHKSDDAQFQAQIADYLDVDCYLRFLAATSFVSNSDSFFSLGHNFYLYLHPKTGRIHFIPWDLDRAFANFGIFGSNAQQMDLSLTHPYPGNHRLTERLLAIPEVNEQYKRLLQELASTAFAKQKLLDRVEALENLMRDVIAAETAAAAARKEGKGGPGFLGTPPDMKLYVEKRTESVEAQVAGTSKGFAPAAWGAPGNFKVGPMLARPIIAQYDADKDNVMSKGEWMTVAAKVFDAAQKDSDGKAAEKALADGLNGMFPKPEPAPGTQPFPGPGGFLAGAIVKRVDVDKDSKVTRDEILTAAEKLFAEFDKQQTGQLDEAAMTDLLNALFPPPAFGPPPPSSSAPPNSPDGTRPAAP